MKTGVRILMAALLLAAAGPSAAQHRRHGHSAYRKAYLSRRDSTDRQKPSDGRPERLAQMSAIHPDSITLSDGKTYHLIFPDRVKYFSLGNSSTVAAEKIAAYPYGLRVKALEGTPFRGTNLSVVTEDGRFYGYELRHAAQSSDGSYRLIGSREETVPEFYVTDSQLSHLIFPSEIIYVDYGDPCLSVSKAGGTDNIISLKAASPFARATNLTAITSDGKFYTFTIRYSQSPGILSYVIDSRNDRHRVAILDNRELNTSQKESIRRRLEGYRPALSYRKSIGKVQLRLDNVIVCRDLLLFRFRLDNRSNIDYVPDFIRFFIQDMKIRKKTAVQQTEQPMLFSFGMPERVEAHRSCSFTVALGKFTIPDRKKFIVELQELDGGRHFQMNIKNRTVISAQILPWMPEY